MGGCDSFHSSSVVDRRDIRLSFEGRIAMVDFFTSLTSLNGCNQYAAIRKGGLAELTLYAEWELAVAVMRYLPRSGSTLTRLDVRCESKLGKCLCSPIRSGFRSVTEGVAEVAN